ncbi:hypothetical protein [Psychrobacter sp. H8-1]|uniref:hypothetical protein n=1 Tax=Psychrobacter sp. H8-1 TaxID=2774129 RepID=UPI001917BB25|nr:hypothetical protein [Psychrobacter sp. H8-1]
MFKLTAVLKKTNNRLPTLSTGTALGAALLLCAISPSVLAANHSDDIVINNTVANNTVGSTNDNSTIDSAPSLASLANYCTEDIRAQTTPIKYQSAQRQSIDCMFTELKRYQQQALTPRQQYFAYKAQAWLNYAYHQDSIKSKSAAGRHAVQASHTILQALVNDDDEQLEITSDIPVFSALMRPDLWATLNALKDSGGIETAPREMAFSEIALVWAAANQCKRGWRESGSHFRMADRWLEQAREAYVNAHDSQTNVALENAINDYYKNYAPLDPSDDVCRGQTFPIMPVMNKSSANNTHISHKSAPTIALPMPIVTYHIGD